MFNYFSTIHTKNVSQLLLIPSGLDSHFIQYMQKSPRINVSVSQYSRNEVSNCREMKGILK